jgi:hypothetical protein
VKIGVNALYLIPGGVGGTEIYLRNLLVACFRIEHPQSLIDRSRYGSNAGNPLLGAADYRLVYHASNGRSVYSFCMCPGGTVVAGQAAAPPQVQQAPPAPLLLQISPFWFGHDAVLLLFTISPSPD